MEEKTYRILAYIQRIVLPALGALYAAIGGIWGLPYVEAIVGTVAAVDTFMGALLMIDSNKWFADKDIVQK
jgi:hypothetical protein